MRSELSRSAEGAVNPSCHHAICKCIACCVAVLQFRAGICGAAGPGEPGQAPASEDILFCSSLQPQPGLGVVTGLFKLRCSIYF